MNLADNLKKLRKDNNLSQEQLADQLGVSRQSVSKWESGAAYPEMDKVLLLCKLFNVGVDELLNQDIKVVKEDKQSKSNLNKHIDDFLYFITKSIDMFTSMKFKNKVKLLFEELIVICVIWLFFIILGECLISLFYNLFGMFDYNVFHFIKGILGSIYAILAFTIGAILVLHIYKVRYLDYYVIVDKNKNVVEENMDEKPVENMERDKDDANNKIYLEKREKVIIRAPDHASSRFIEGLLKAFLILININVAFIFVGFCFSLVGFVITFVVSFMISKTGLFFIGIILGVLSCIIINLIILDILFNFLMSRKSKWKVLFVGFIFSLIIFGIGCGLGIIGFSNFNFSTDKSVETEEVISMNDVFIIHDFSAWEIKYVETDSNDIRIVAYHSKYYDLVVEEEKYFDDTLLNIYMSYKDDSIMDEYREQIENINHKEIKDYESCDVTIYTSKANIEKLKRNYRQWMYDEYHEYDYDYDEE